MMHAIRNPIEQRLVFFCPVALGDRRGEINPLAHGSYGMSGQMDGHSTMMVDYPASRFMLTDGHWLPGPRWWSAVCFYFPSNAPDPVHSGSANVAFLDGHVGTIPEEDYLNTHSYWDLNVRP